MTYCLWCITIADAEVGSVGTGAVRSIAAQGLVLRTVVAVGNDAGWLGLSPIWSSLSLLGLVPRPCVVHHSSGC